MYSFNSDNIHPSSPRNFMAGNTVYIQDEITENNCAFLIADLNDFIMNDDNRGKQLQFMINSPGGDLYVAYQICSLINMAKIRDITVLTWVLGYAASAGSLIAVHGDIKTMSRCAHHMIHFGCIWNVITKESELDKSTKFNKIMTRQTQQMYLDCCPKLTKEKLQELESDEYGRIFADECLKLGICNHIVEDELKIVQKRKNTEQQWIADFYDFKKQHKVTNDAKKTNNK